MKKYKAYLVGCAQTVIDIEADNMKDARIKLKEIIATEYNDDERRLETVELYEISHFIDFDITQFYEQLNTNN